MNAPKTKNLEADQRPIFEPFPQPQTMPKGWDFSGFATPESLPTVESAGDEAES
jgi:hypothetical protein